MRTSARVIVVSLLMATACVASAEPLVVSAAASLTQAFRDIGRDFEAAHRGVEVVFNFAASDVLLAQIARGAPADVFASADEPAMDRGERNGLLMPGSQTVFAANALVLVVPRAAAPIATLENLADPRVRRIAMGSPQIVPAGRYARDALQRAGLWNAIEPRLVFTQNVRQTLDYVAREEADAGFVYATDASLLPDKVRIACEVPTATPVRYPISVVRDTRQPQVAKAFVAFVVGPPGQQSLRRHGFRAP